MQPQDIAHDPGPGPLAAPPRGLWIAWLAFWALMLLLFVGGVMNLLWVAVITMIVLAEKLLHAAWLRHVIGIALCVAAVLVLVDRT